MLHYLRVGLWFECLLVALHLVEKHVYLIDARLVRMWEISIRLLFLVIILAYYHPLLLETLHNHVHTFICILHDHLKLCFILLLGLWINAPNEGDTVRVIEIALDLFQGSKGEPANELGYILHFVVRIKIENHTICHYGVEISWNTWPFGWPTFLLARVLPLAREDWRVLAWLPDAHVILDP